MIILVTGGAGFIGSHLVDTLLIKEERVRVIDNFSTGNPEYIKKWSKLQNFDFIKGDLLNIDDVKKAVKGCNTVYHLAANPEVRLKKVKTSEHFKQNIEATYNLLEVLCKNEDFNKFIFTSSSTVYGEPSIFPTPETYGPLRPISSYGASKLAAEILIQSYSSLFNFNSIILRLANIIGPRSTHGVIFDFVKKLNNSPTSLEVLGDGTQTKSYLYIDDCINGIVMCANNTKKGNEIYNLGSEDKISVKDIANIVTNEYNGKKVNIKYTGGVDGGRGWRGDVKTMQLDITKLNSLGWYPKNTSVDSIQKTVKWMFKHISN